VARPVEAQLAATWHLHGDEPAHGLAFRQAMLGHLVTGLFLHPNETWFLYDQVRSGAVHGEDAPAVDWDSVRGFAWTVRTTVL